MFNRSDILRQAWADYRRDEFKGWGVRRGEAFNRKHFAYCLRCAWAVAKEVAAREALPVPAPAPVKVMSPAVAARADDIRGAILDLEMGDFIDWTQHRSLHAQLAALAA